MSNVEIICPKDIIISDDDNNLLQNMFKNCSKIIINKMLGGFSEAKTLHILPLDKNGCRETTKVVKIGIKELIDKEYNSYLIHIKNKIPRKNCIDLSEPEIFGDKAAFFEDFQMDTDWFNDITLHNIYHKDSKVVIDKISELLKILSDLSPHKVDTFIDIGRKYKQKLNDKFFINPSNSFKIKKQIIYKMLYENELFTTEKNDRFLNIPEYKIDAIEPFYAILNLKFDNISSKEKVIHGDLNSRNILIDKNIVLIDYAKTKLNHHVRDIAKLEATLKFEVLQDISLKKRLIFEKILISKFQLDEKDIRNSGIGAELERLFLILKKLRNSLDIKDKDDIDPSGYFISLFFYTISVLSFREDIDSDILSHAYISAGLIARRIGEKYKFDEKDENQNKFINEYKKWIKKINKEQLKKLSFFCLHPYPEAPNFTGRKKEKEMLNEWLTKDDEHPFFSMVAIGGMGKSALAWRWLHDEVLKEDNQFKGIVWWSFYDEKSGFEKFLDYCLKEIMIKNPKNFVSTRDKMDAVYKYFQQNPYVLVLDGLERMLRAYAGFGSPYQGDEVKKDEMKDFDKCIDPNFAFFLRWFASEDTKTKTLITTRIHPNELENLKGVIIKNLLKLEKEDAVQYFKNEKINGTRVEFEAASKAYGYHPLCLRLLVGMVKNDKKYPNDIKQWVKKNPLPKLMGEKQKHHILQLAYDSLDENQQKMIGRIAAFRSSIDFEILEIFFTYGDEEALQNMIDDFKRRGLLLHIHDKKKNIEKYDMHPIIRRYCYDILANPKRLMNSYGIILNPSPHQQ